jgi:glyoxylase-like metal-dependent hydrolase (beta-lactamase superfamily II)
MIESALTAVVADKIWTLDRPVWFSGARLRARTTVVRLDDGSLLLHTPAPPTDALAAQLRALGPVRWLVVPNCWHHLGTPAAAAYFPEARVVGPASAQSRNKALRLHVDIQDTKFSEQVPEFEALPLHGVPFWDETVLYHRPTRTLLGADIVCWANGKDHWTWRYGARITGCYERVRVPPDARKKISDKAAAAHSIQAMLERPAQRLIIGHGDVIEEGYRDRLAQAWRLEGVEV